MTPADIRTRLAGDGCTISFICQHLGITRREALMLCDHVGARKTKSGTTYRVPSLARVQEADARRSRPVTVQGRE